MKILLAQRLPWFRSFAGETKFNRWLIEALAERGHSCHVVALAASHEGSGTRDELRQSLGNLGVPCLHSSPTADAYACGGVEIHAVADGYHLWTALTEQIRQCDPDCVLISQDRTYLSLATALAETEPARVVFMAHSQATLPFGPECFAPDEAQTRLLGRAGRIVASSHYIRDYISRWSGLPATALRFHAYGPGPFPTLGRPDTGFITLVNPSQLKGVTIFEALARARPDDLFAAVPTWATTNADLEPLRRLPNVRLLPPAENIDDVLAQTRLLIVPSLWGEGFGIIAVDAMLRGIPVLASDLGGLREAKMGVDYLLPVRPIEAYREQADERGLPIPIVPPQDIGPWIEAIERLEDPRHYRELSHASRSAALQAVSSISAAPFEEFLGTIPMAGPDSAPRMQPLESPATGTLSRDRLELLARLLDRDRG